MDYWRQWQVQNIPVLCPGTRDLIMKSSLVRDLCLVPLLYDVSTHESSIPGFNSYVLNVTSLLPLVWITWNRYTVLVCIG